ncbi:TniQ family protein [Ruegeria conchae]|uniref:TniQ family protein n=1 Tax=Ruegeria conchae TaxID=981384 RepID=UPI0014814138|nr:TniQ family protein [Ruegeria conchae]UWR03684.1 TniQ family protein [Ruegeria conchae]
MNRLALTLRPAALETPTSFLSRLAARNGCPDKVSFCYDLGLDLIAISNGERSAIEDLCHFAGLPNDAFAKTAVIKTTKMSCRVGQELFENLTLNRVEIRVCPKCQLEQHQLSSDLWAKVHKMHWQVPQIHSCYLHNEKLLTITAKSHHILRFDSSSAIRSAWNEIRNADSPLTADSFDN